MWPDMPPAAATVIGLIGMNMAIFLLWRFPPAWKWLNRFFISVPAEPFALSIIGSFFSHHTLKHIGMNMLGLWVVGTRRKLRFHVFLFFLLKERTFKY